MKAGRKVIQSRTLAMVALVAGFAMGSGAQLVANGGFEDDPLGTSSSATTNAVVDTTTFSGWRIYSVGEPPAPFTATIVTNASEGNQAILLDFSDLSIGADHGFDLGGPVVAVADAKYTLSFDAAWVGGSTKLDLVFAEYGEDGLWLGQQRVVSVTVSSTEYNHFTVPWSSITGASNTAINIAFHQSNEGASSSTILLDNVRFTRDDLPADGLYTPVDSFSRTDHVVSSTVFHWYTPTGHQLDGPWLPLEGRPLWTGNPDWWEKQVKQMMMANIDVLNIELIPIYEEQRVNLFRALNQLRYEGYDVPKVVPFLDPLITWDGLPNPNLATTAGKDEVVGQYIRFFNQYFGANQDAASGDYLARYDGQVVLDTWHVHLNMDNISSLTRNDVTSRLLAEFGAGSPFTNDIYMITTAYSPQVFSFADEKIPQFEVTQYFNKKSFNGIDTVQAKPGYWDQNIRNPGDFLARDGGSHYAAAWSSINGDSSIEHVNIESWNEYDEGSGIYAADPTNSPYISTNNASGNTDTWSGTDDPYEYIRTTAAGAAAFNDIPANDAVVIWDNFPTNMYVGETQSVTVVVRNAGDAAWTAAAGYQFGDKAGAGAHFGADRYLLDDTADEIPIYGGIFRGRPKTFQVTLVAPATPGTYATHWGMVQDGGAGWFGEDLAKTIEVYDPFDIPVQVDPEATVPDGYNVVSWLSGEGWEYSVSWSSDLVYEPFVALATGIQWPQASYTDQTIRAGTEGFYKVDVAAAAPPPAPLIANGDFETAGSGGDSDPADWFRTNTTIVQRWAEAGQPGHGDWMLLIQDGENAWHWASQKPAATPGVEYTATAQFKTVMQAGEVAYIYMGWLNSSGTEIGNTLTTYTSTDPDYGDWAWVTRFVTGVAPAGTVQVEVRVMAYADGGGDSAFFADNVELTESN